VICLAEHSIVSGNESLPLADFTRHTDSYSQTKTVADELILRSRGRRLRGGGYLKPAVIRPAAIYGEGEGRHFPRIVRMADLGMFVFTVGGKDVLSDWVYIDNLVG
jgi:nucleoside-diphosphate-sugar epimerase